MSENPHHSMDKFMFRAIEFNELLIQKPQQRLCHGESNCFHKTLYFLKQNAVKILHFPTA
jgi:hypothetical protein